jgi:5-methylthioadenosine/S-adenosylhomocysteine deaminase
MTLARYVLRGTLVTFRETGKKIIKDGFVGIDDKRISFVRSARQAIPHNFRNAKIIRVDGYLYPGFIDLHNHIAFNFRQLWTIAEKYADRCQWPGEKNYKIQIKMITNLMCLANPVQLVKYAETKALAGGTTTIDGYSRFNKSYAAWLLKNVEMEPFGDTEPPIYQSVSRITQEDGFRDMARKLESGNAFIYHLAEGTSPKLQEEYTDLESRGLLKDKLVAIHCIAITKAQWTKMGQHGVKLVWSPLSNFLLYGKTADVISAKNNGVLICLGSDWSPSGSKSLLWELKVAYLVNKKDLKNAFTEQELVEMITINPAKAIGWDDKIGRIAPGYIADLVAFDQVSNDAYHNVIESTEENLRLAIIDGLPRYGDLELMDELEVAASDRIRVGSREKAFDIFEPGLKHGDMTLCQAQTALKTTMADPKTAAQNLSTTLAVSPEEEPLRLIIEEDVEPVGLAVEDTIEWFLNLNADTLNILPKELDPLTMLDDKDFIIILKANQNVPKYLNKLEEYL